MQIRMKIGEIARREDREEDSKCWYEKALADGIECFHLKPTDNDLHVLAKLCQRLAKFPYEMKYGPTYVQNKNLLHDAVCYLNHALQLGGYWLFIINYRLGLCLYEMEEYRKAIKWMKRAMQLCSNPTSFCLTRICEYILMFYSKCTEERTSNGYLMDELRTVFIAGKKKFGGIEGIKHTLNYISKVRELCPFLKHLNKMQNVNPETKTLILKYIEALDHGTADTADRQNDDIIDLTEMFSHIIDSLPEASSELVDMARTENFLPPSVSYPSSEDAQTPYNFQFKYNFFISHSIKDKDWVNGFLLFQLETKLDFNDVSLKGCISDRNFTEEETIINNIVSAVQNSYKIFLILTPDFVESRWCDYEADQALIEIIETRDDCLIPVLLKGSSDIIPVKLRNLTILDLTGDTIQFEEILNLKKLLNG